MKQPSLLPGDTYGRIACLLTGLFFGGVGIWSFTSLVRFNRFPPAAITAFEFALLVTLLGCTFLTWALFTPQWLIRTIEYLACHFLILVFILFLPIAIDFLIFVMNGVL